MLRSLCLLAVATAACSSDPTPSITPRPEPGPAASAEAAASVSSAPAQPIDRDSPSATPSAPPPVATLSELPSLASSSPPAPIGGDKRTQGPRAPAFSEPRVNGGQTIQLASFKDKVVVLFFFATWAAPAKRGFAQLAEVQKRVGADKMAFIGVSVDDASEARQLSEWVRKEVPSAIVVHDRNQSIAKAYEPAKLPSFYVLDRGGVIRMVLDGVPAEDDGTLEKQVVALVQ